MCGCYRRTCPEVRCLYCGDLRAHCEGTGNGRCKGCLFGMLPGWSGNNNPELEGRPAYPLACASDRIRCAYVGCGEMAVTRDLPGARKQCCRAHAEKILARRRK